MTTDVVLNGCRTNPLASYLSSLGLLRAVSRLFDGDATGHWHHRRLVLGSSFDNPGELARALAARFEPLPIVSPWNSGSGFAGNGKSSTAEALLDWVRASKDVRLREFRTAVGVGDHVVATSRAMGYGSSGGALWDKAHKPQVLQLCRNLLSDAAVEWLDAAVALGGEDGVSYARILGTGGNIGRLDLSATYIRQTQLVFEHKNSVDWLQALLVADHSVRLPKESLSQYDPAGVGAPDEPNSVGNPWAYLLLIEGALFFATAVVRRRGAEYAQSALPFQVGGSTAGFGSAAAGERAVAELWLPEWNHPMGVADLAALFGEGRIEWNGHPARTGLDAVRALANWGVDRAVDAFHRYVFVERLGQSPLAVYADRIPVGRRTGVRLLAPLDRWIGLIEREGPSNLLSTRIRLLQNAIYAHARSDASRDLVEVLAALGALRIAVGRSGKVRSLADQLAIPNGKDVGDELVTAIEFDSDLRIAIAIAAGRDRVSTTPRVTLDSLGAGLVAALAHTTRRRAFPGTTPEEDGQVAPAVRGARIVFDRGPTLRRGDITALVAGNVDERRVVDLIAGLAVIDWPTESLRLQSEEPTCSDPAIDLLLQFTAAKPTHIGGTGGEAIEATLRPGFNWPAMLIADRAADVLDDAAARLRIAGVHHVVTPSTSHSGPRLAAMLLIPTTQNDRYEALKRIARLPEAAPNAEDDEEINA